MYPFLQAEVSCGWSRKKHLKTLFHVLSTKLLVGCWDVLSVCVPFDGAREVHCLQFDAECYELLITSKLAAMVLFEK